MKAVIAEKPSVAREIAMLLGATEKKDGFLTGNDYCVTWAFGHLVGLAMPEDYGISGFQREQLPLIPNPFILTVRKIKKDKGYVTDSGALKQLNVIKEAVNRCESVVVATDAGREGELIFRYIYEYIKCKKPFERLWISSLTEKAILDGFANLKPGSDFNGLYKAAKCRSRADWLVGINASQALTIVAGNGIYSLGRVQTPTLALICKKYREHESFVVKNYWQIQLEHRKDFIDFKSVSKVKYDDKKKAEEVLRSIQRQGRLTVSHVETKTVSEKPPLLFDLTGLQKEANKKLNLSAEETLNIAQSLYEKKFITYPRTGSKYIPEDVWPEIPHLIRALGGSPQYKELVAKVNWGRFNKNIVNDLKVTDHHGLLITERIPSAVSHSEKAVYEMIALRLLEAIGGICTKEITDVNLEVLNNDFIMKGCRIIEVGWRRIKGSFTDEEGDMESLPELNKGHELKINNATILEKKTMPPALYTEAGLLSAMESAGKEIEMQEERMALQNIGIGTPATRASIIETLFSRGYIKREKKSLIPTEKGLKVYDLVKDKKIANVLMTAEWELALQKIETGEAGSETFENDMKDYAASITSELLNAPIVGENYLQLTCPKCKRQQLLAWEKFIKCSNKSCDWIQFLNVCGVQVDIKEIEKLITGGKTSLIKGMKSKAGKKFDAYIVLNGTGETSFEFENDKTKKR
ncbi:MAG: DNA topoisomerase 3 [Sphingobacteriaceae bacterium]|nr:DNA topoisomerase 3 [Sphingobacteriaceae bacterium]